MACSRLGRRERKRNCNKWLEDEDVRTIGKLKCETHDERRKMGEQR
jgi:hypothetical protein